ncbi:MAG: hypothetical protein AB7O24_09640 [Kofleriaceae bacterium]
MYRSDVEAGRARLDALEAQLRRLTDQLAELERAAGEGCTSREHARQAERLAELTERVEAERHRARDDAGAIGRVIPGQAVLEEQITALQRQLRDLELLGRGDAAMALELADYQAEITRLEPSVEALERQVASDRDLAMAVGYGSPVWAPRRGPLRSELRDFAPIPLVGMGVAFMVHWWTAGPFTELVIGAMLAAAAGWLVSCKRTERRLERALVGADEVCGRRWGDARELRIFSMGDDVSLSVVFRDRTFVFDRGMARFDAVLNAAKAAASKHAVLVVGDWPKLLGDGS